MPTGIMGEREAEKKLVLVDGSSLVYRSYFAIPRLSNRLGLPTNAVYGLTTVLRKILAEEQPDHAAVAFDTRGPTFRHQAFADYKSQRPAMPDDLAAQLPHAREVCQVLGLPLLELPGVEADDVIGTLAQRAAGAGFRVFIVSSDKDFFQLVSDRITVVRPGKDTRYDPTTVSAEFGVPPEKVTDVLGLAGDSIDNVPGVPGIGEKGAVALVREWGSLEAALANADKVKNKRQREGLQQNAELARLSKNLVRIATDLDLPVPIDSLRYHGADRARALALFEKLGFTSLLKDYLEPARATPLTRVGVLERASDVSRLLGAARARGRLALAPVAEGDRLLGFGLAVDPEEAAYAALGGAWSEEELRAALKPALADGTLPKWGHDLKRSRVLLALLDLPLVGIGFDTMIASYVVNPSKRSHDLETLSLEMLRQQIGAAAPAPGETGRLPGLEGGESLSRTGAERAAAVLKLQPRLSERMDEEGVGPLYNDIELPLVEVLADMELAGIRLDVEALAAMSTEMTQELERLTAEIYDLAGVEFNINSPKQLSEILFEKMNLPSFKKTQKQRTASTRVDVLEELAQHFELPRKILDYRSLAKLKGTYVDALPLLVNPRTRRLHTTFNQTVAATGRLSSSDPNLQNIPIRTELGRRIRRAFVAEPGWRLLSADYSQIELRVLAHLSEDPVLIEAFREGEDIHRSTALRVFGESSGLSESEQRRRAKIINFSIIYGKTAFTLGKEFGVSTREAQAFIDSYFERYPRVRELLDRIIREARQTGKVRTLFGRIRYIPEIGSRNRVAREAAERVAVNTPIQGTAADLIKKAMVDLHRELGRRALKSRLLLQVHDELVLEVPEAECEVAARLVREVMEGVHPMAVPLKVDVALGNTWKH
jgi:DNA polymerase-1